MCELAGARTLRSVSALSPSATGRIHDVATLRRCDGCAALADLLSVSEEPSGMTTPL